MAKPNEYDPNNPAHKAIAKKIAEKRATLTAHDKATLADELNSASPKMGIINKILGR